VVPGCNLQLESPVLNSLAIKLHKVFLSKYYNNMPLHMWILFHHHMQPRQVSPGSMIHAGRYLNDKEICYLTTVILTANV